MKQEPTFSYTYYGSRVKAGELIGFVEHLIGVNLGAEAAGQRKTPVCIWGRHGIGKTEIVRFIAERNGYDFAYIAPAQFEEMGDLLGMPAIEAGRTVFRRPDWVPAEAGPGILLIDDVNRADDRILRGIMQLLQNYELVSWKLPPKWQIILTANPEGGDYSITPLDDAMLTRMMHVTLAFDLLEWATWAEREKIDSRGIDFVLTYPEVINLRRTTPRTLVQFFNAIAGIADLEKEIGLVQILAASCLDEQAVAAFLSFVNQGLGALPKPEEILDAVDFKNQILPRIEQTVKKEPLRVDILSALATRLLAHCRTKESFSLPAILNLKAFLLMDFLPNDIRVSTARDLVAGGNAELQQLVADPEIGRLMLI